MFNQRLITFQQQVSHSGNWAEGGGGGGGKVRGGRKGGRLGGRSDTSRSLPSLNSVIPSITMICGIFLGAFLQHFSNCYKLIIVRGFQTPFGKVAASIKRGSEGKGHLALFVVSSMPLLLFIQHCRYANILQRLQLNNF